MDIVIVNLYVFIVGLLFGSFFNVCIFRIPEGISISRPPSHCMSCNTKLKPIDLIPVLSYLMSGRKCRYCYEKISSRYVIVELIVGILFLAVFMLYGVSKSTVYYLILVSLLIIITFIDIDHFIIPDKILVFGAIFAIIFNFLFKEIPIKDSIIGAFICGGSVWIIVILIEFIIKKECMGGGDVKLFAMLGFYMGVKNGLLTALLSVYVGAVYGICVIILSKIKGKEYNSVIPYGPFISIGALITILCGKQLFELYFSMIM
ncbi:MULTISPECIES: A24 family peptidase [unclassified Clostridioides]|uniref:prepilin peptidase n=1 Tax=unclassified Clostridioides TaxID=2635829 RepID=UPI001D11CF19|nr:prepilin peptidase [Clostridioides sp. ES-S-0171-01]UDN54556.1 prepilin peptidase [Clostridioides sp. ES-S-0054-01]